jgi:integrase
MLRNRRLSRAWTIRLDPETVAAIKEHRDAQRLERALAGDAYHRKAPKVPVGTMHTLRHTAATLMLTNGVPIHVASARLGDRPETILKTYAHLPLNSDEQAAVGIAALLAVR